MTSIVRRVAWVCLASGVLYSSAASADPGDKLPLYLTRTLDASALKGGTEPYNGDGNSEHSYLIERDLKADVEVALKVKYRQGRDIRPTYIDRDGIVHIEVPIGAQTADGPGCVPLPFPPTSCRGTSANLSNRAAWSFDYSISTALDGATQELSAINGTLKIDLDPSSGVEYATLRLAEIGPVPPNPADDNGWGWGYPQSGLNAITDDEGTQQVTQNSRNYSFIDTDLNTPGTQVYDPAFGEAIFDIELSAKKKRGPNEGTASIHIRVHVVSSPAQ